ncbi:hypothetical protein VTN49DRAFT_3588 [Thermomyces lanuginosus]|uniref:uncharacterized protein n=1 Tax=Thermomyces lanuginosus TaxID=5541 RepID=UPI00374447DD
MGRRGRARVRDPSMLTGKPLSETVERSIIDNGKDGWVTSPDLKHEGLSCEPDAMHHLTNFLLGNPNMNSSHLFRADILYDSAGILKTPEEKERMFTAYTHAEVAQEGSAKSVEAAPPKDIPGFVPVRTIVRRLIPRNSTLDRRLEQTCHQYEEKEQSPSVNRSLYVYTPHYSSPKDAPFYHPVVQSLAYLYEFRYDSADDPASPKDEENTKETGEAGERTRGGKGTLSLHILPFPASEDFDPFSARLERTLQALLSTHVRLARNARLPPRLDAQESSQTPPDEGYNPVKDNIIPRHLVQNTYSRLKLQYASDLCRDWVEDTQPSKHVFEDLAIAAFLIELWRNMYGVPPKAERKDDDEHRGQNFPGFVDIACGNGVLVYILLMEGYEGWGFDARRRKTWTILPDWVQARLRETVYIPKPFVDAVSSPDGGLLSKLTAAGIPFHTDDDIPRDTFIISNHADELTVWTPLLAARAAAYLRRPFLSIPCCSHSLSGAKFRYPPPNTKRQGKQKRDDTSSDPMAQSSDQSGDLKALRAAKQASSTVTGDPNSAAVMNSTYGSLTAKTIAIAEEIGYEVERTLLRIPSTRNMGIIGDRKRTIERLRRLATGEKMAEEGLDGANADQIETIEDIAREIVRRECARDGGIEEAAKIWIERAKGLFHVGARRRGIGHD